MRFASYFMCLFIFQQALANYSAPKIRKPASVELVDSRMQSILGYFDCFSKDNLFKLPKLKTCLSRFIDADLPGSEKDRLASWPVFNEVEIEKFFECPAELLAKRKPFGLSTSLAYCARGKINENHKVVSFYFVAKDDSSVKIHSIFY